MSRLPYTNGPLVVTQPEKFPFNIETVNADGQVVWFERRHAYGTEQKSVADVMSGRGLSGVSAAEVAECVEANAKQLGDAYLRAAAPTMYEEMLRYLPLLQRCEEDAELWAFLTEGTGVATLNGFKDAIKRAEGGGE